jgi:hypothetical protein
MFARAMFVSFPFLALAAFLVPSNHSQKNTLVSTVKLSPNAKNRRRYIFVLEGKNTVVSAADPQPVRVPARTRHAFKVDDTHDGPCTVEISTDVLPRSAVLEPNLRGTGSEL